MLHLDNQKLQEQLSVVAVMEVMLSVQDQDWMFMEELVA